MKNKKKIAIINLGKSYGGAEKLIENLVSEMENEYEFTLIINQKGEFLKKGKIDGIKNIIQIDNSSKMLMINICKIYKYLKKEDIKIIHSHGTPSNLVGSVLKKMMKVRFIATIHSDIKYDFSGVKLKIYQMIEKRTLKTTDYALSVSKNLKEKLIDRHDIEKEKIRVVYNGINIESKEKKIKRNEKIFKFLFVGRLVEVKNVELLIKSLYQLKKTEKNFECEIVGEGEKKIELQKLSQNLGLEKNIKFLGYRDDINEVMAESDALIMTSKMEGIPLTIIEAFAMNLLVISTDVGGISEMIEDNYNGILLKDDNPIYIGERLKLILNDRHNINSITKNANEDYHNKWNVKVSSNQYSVIYG